MSIKAWLRSKTAFTSANGLARGVVVVVAFLMTDTAFADVVINDPVAYWSFDDTGSVLSNQVTSSRYHDASVLFGTPSAGVEEGASGLAGNALVLDGTCALRLPYHQDNLGLSFTFSFWYWQLTNDTRQCVYQTRDNFTATYEAVAGTNDLFASYVGQELAGGITTGPREWIHIAHTFSTSNNIVTLSVYSNGVLKLTKNSTSNNMFSANQVRGLHVGAFRSATGPADGRCFKGMIDELALWNRALSAVEVEAVYQRGAAGQKLDVSSVPLPVISLEGTHHSFLLQVADGLPGGMFDNGWLLNGIQDTVYPFTATDTAGDADDALGRVPDTGGHVGGPFHAQVADVKWQIPQTTALRQLGQGDLTAEAWFRTTSTNMNILMGNWSSSYNGVVNLQLETNNTIRLYLKNTAGVVDSLTLPTATNNTARDGKWHHLAGIRRDTTMFLYLDGLEMGSQNSAAGSYTLGGSYYYLGRDSRGTSGQFNGEIGHARLWTRALSSNEVASIAAFGMPGVGVVTNTGLLAEYALYNPFNAVRANPGYRISLTPPQLKQLPLTNFTCEAVFRTTDTGRGILMGSYTNNIQGAINIELYTDNKVRFWQCNTAGTVLDVNVSADSIGINTRDGAWHRLAAVRCDGKVYLFVDGRQLTAVTDSLGPYLLRSAFLDLGRDERVGTLPLKGDLAHARIWNRALTTNEVAGLAASNAVPTDGLIAQYAPTPTNTLHTAGFQGDRFLRSFTTPTNTAVLVFTDLPRHNTVGIGLLLAQLDQLEPLANNDHFEIRVDGSEVLSVGLGPNQGSEPQVNTNSFRLFDAAADAQLFKDTMTVGGEDLFFCGTDYGDYKDHVYDLSALAALQAIPHTGNTLVLEILGVQNTPGENECFGIDQLQLTVYPLRGTLISVY
jgi:hypothetical protein